MELVGFLFFGIYIGIVIGIEYIPHQIRRKDEKVMAQIANLLDEAKK